MTHLLAPYVRDPAMDRIDTLRKFMEVIPKQGRDNFHCLTERKLLNGKVWKCGYVLDNILFSLMNAKEDSYFRCPKCGVMLRASAGLMAFVALKFQQSMKARGM